MISKSKVTLYFDVFSGPPHYNHDNPILKFKSHLLPPTVWYHITQFPTQTRRKIKKPGSSLRNGTKTANPTTKT